MLEKLDMSKKLSKTEYSEQIESAQSRLRKLEYRIYKQRIALLCVFEGSDAAGKGGTIKRLTEMLDPRGFTVSSFAAPQGEEKTHHYLWRFWRHLPCTGHLAIFDRSYYGRVLVERVEHFASPPEWQRAYQEINEFESHQASFGMVICKFWLHVTPEEQLRRFRRRELDPFRQYKLTEEDWRNRAKTPEYTSAVEDMLVRTSTPHAPWNVIQANDKHYARVKVVESVVASIENRLN
jgi:polyphosphate kinase 2 (PPK2 family)